MQYVHHFPPEQIPATPKLLYFAGLDLGQSRDYTALAIIERTQEDEDAEPNFAVRHLHRYELGTSYPTIVADVVELLRREPLAKSSPHLAIDQTGVGAAVADLFRRERLPGGFKPIIITGGDQVTYENGVYRVPKRDLVGLVQVCLQTSRLKIAPTLAYAPVLQHELENFQVKITDAANDTYGSWRENVHDDLVLAVALALWTANEWRAPQLPAQSYSFSMFR